MANQVTLRRAPARQRADAGFAIELVRWVVALRSSSEFQIASRGDQCLLTVNSRGDRLLRRERPVADEGRMSQISLEATVAHRRCGAHRVMSEGRWSTTGRRSRPLALEMA